jgi:hypothetical protein
LPLEGSLQRVHLRVNDAVTGKPTPVRIRVTDAEGNYRAPLGRLVEFATGPNQDVGGNLQLGMKPHAYIDGACEIDLPPGNVHVQVHKGPEYTPLDLDLTLRPGQLSLRLTIARWLDLRTEGWFSGDVRAHFLTPHAALLEAQAEDLAVVNLLAQETLVPGPFGRSYSAIPNILAFSGQAPAVETPGHMVVVNTLNSHPSLGRLGLLNCHRPVFPLTFGGPGGKDDWTLADWCDQCHRKAGLVVWAKTGHEARDFLFGEPLADLLLGKIDAFEIDFFEASPFDALHTWYDLLQVGLHVPLVGGSGKDGNGIALGSMRTYARVQPARELTYRSWIEAVRLGRTFATNAPLLVFTANHHDPGAELDLPESGGMVHLCAKAQSLVPFRKLEILANGRTIAAADPDATERGATLELDCPLTESSWLAARCTGEDQLPHRPANQRVFAHTSPIHVRLGNHAFSKDAHAVTRLTRQLDRMLEWVKTQARCNEHDRDRLRAVFAKARKALTGEVE